MVVTMDLLFCSLYIIALGIQQQYKANQVHTHKTDYCKVKLQTSV